jgi:hypothetical protein
VSAVAPSADASVSREPVAGAEGSRTARADDGSACIPGVVGSSAVGSVAAGRTWEVSPTGVSDVGSGAGSAERSVLGATLLSAPVGSMPVVSPMGVSDVGSGAGSAERSVLGTTLLNVPAGSVPAVRAEGSVPGKAEVVAWTASVVEITLDVLEGSSESPGAGLEVRPSVGEVAGAVEWSTEPLVG